MEKTSTNAQAEESKTHTEDVVIEEEKTIKCKTTKEIKAMARPEFEQYPEKFYPVETFKKLGFSRSQCPKCNHFFWRHSEKRVTCGDSNCEGVYSFIGNGVGKGKKITYAEAWKGFERSMTSARVPCNSIKRYPVVARWRNDVDFVAAGIFCFQPYCVTGELDPPANPLICPQFCVRFNDLDNIGLTGRHYSGFIMLGIQVFNYPDNYVFFKDECVEFNYRWLTEELEIEPDEITFIEDVWAGGGNLGPSIEYFVRGLEVGNMVFMQYKTFHDGSREELAIKIIDTGIGLERIAWLYNGTATSYMDTFHNAMQFLAAKLGISVDQEIWQKFGPYSCLLNIDEVDDIEKTWERVAGLIGESVDKVKQAITPIKDLYIILDHTRSILLTIIDGSLPSNVGGGGNVRNILRRVFSILVKNKWDEVVTVDVLLEMIEFHKRDLEGIFGEFPDYKSFADIIKNEHVKWLSTDEKQKGELEKILKKSKGILKMDDWITMMQSQGIPADKISQMSGLPIPGNLYYEISQRQERVAKATEIVLYNTVHLPETENLYYQHHDQYEFEAKVIDVFQNVLDHQKRNILILDKSCIYPTSGGQQHDTGTIVIEGSAEVYKIVNAEKVGKVVLHILDKELPEADQIKGKKVQGTIDQERRTQLRAHHTGTHIVFAACRKVLGPHVWQNGAKKTIENAHLDITHFKSVTSDEEKQIENEANKIIQESHEIQKSFMDKAEAEREYGFKLYQGGVVPGNSLRVVNIKDVDTEACCGTHCDNTSEVGQIRILKTIRISDGIVRLYYVADKRAREVLSEERDMIQSLCDQWGIGKHDILKTATKFFKESKKLRDEVKDKNQSILKLQVKFLLKDDKKLYFIRTEEEAPSIYFSFIPQYAQELKEKGKTVLFVGSAFLFGLIGDPASVDLPTIEKVCNEMGKPKITKLDKVKFDYKIKGKKPVETDGIVQLSVTGGDLKQEKIIEVLKSMGVEEID